LTGIAPDSLADTDDIPEAVPRANFHSVPPPNGEVTVVAFDLETTDCSKFNNNCVWPVEPNTHKNDELFLRHFSSLKHKVLRVSYCDRPLFVVRRASSIVRKPLYYAPAIRGKVGGIKCYPCPSLRNLVSAQ